MTSARKRSAEDRPAVGRQLEAGGAGMPAMPDEQVSAGGQGRRRGRTRRPLRQDARITPSSSVPTTAGRPRSSASRPATRPITPTGHSPRTTVATADARLGGEDGLGLGHGGLRQLAPGQVRRLERGRRARAASTGSSVSRRLGRVERIADPPGRVEPRRDDERHGLEVHGSRRRSRRARGSPRARQRRRSQPLEPEPGDRPVLADDRGDVGNGPDRRQLGQLERPLRSAGNLGEHELGDLEGDPAAGEPWVGIVRIGALRIDERDRRRRLGGQRGGGRSRSR